MASVSTEGYRVKRLKLKKISKKQIKVFVTRFSSRNKLKKNIDSWTEHKLLSVTFT